MSNAMKITEGQLEKVLKTVGCQSAKPIEIKEIVKQDTDQIVMLAEYRGGNSERKHLAYVNFKQGYPTTDQIFDSIYGVGKGSDLRIILYDNKNGYDGKNPASCEWVVRPAMDILNSCQVNLMLLETDEGCDTLKWVNHEVYGLYEIEPEYFFDKLPSAEQFRAEEFWSLYFNSLNECFYEPWYAFRYGFRNKDDWGHEPYIDPIGRIPVYWRDDGVKYVIRKWHDNHGYLEKVLCAARAQIVDRYGKENVSFKYDKGALEMVIHYSVIPFNWMMNATPAEKMAFADKLHDDIFSLQFRLQELFDEMDDMFEEVTEAVTF